MKTRTRNLISRLALPVIGCFLAVSAVRAAEPDQISALIVTGDDVAPYHDWRENTAAIQAVMNSSGRFEVRVCEDPLILESAAALKRYQVVVLNLYNQSLPTLTDVAKENLLDFVKAGNGFVVHHLSSASFKEWDAFRELCGRYWVMGQSGHGPRSVFQCHVANPNHPITRGIDDFRIFDELYAKLQGNAEINVLVNADSDWSNQTEPLAFTHSYGNGRVFHLALGHDRKAIMNPTMQKLINRGTEWAATGNVTVE